MRKTGYLVMVLAVFLALNACREDVTPPEEVKLIRKVYVLGNEAGNNLIQAFNWTENGDLSTSGTFSTGAAGSGIPLKSHGSMVITPSGKYLIAVNAGSNSISVLNISGDDLFLSDTQSVSGSTPVSIAASNNLVYVLHVGGNGGLTGFSLGSNGKLSVINGAQTSFSDPGLNPVQISFTGDYSGLLVTNRDSARLSYFPLNSDGTLSVSSSYSIGSGFPAGLSSTGVNSFLVAQQRSDTIGVVHYSIDAGNITEVGSNFYRQSSITNSFPSVISTPDGRYHYLLNDFNSSISLYRMNAVTRQPLLIRQVAAITPPNPGEVACSKDSRFLFVLSKANGIVSGYSIDPVNGFLDAKRPIGSLPTSASGIAVYVE